jgi:hypothetical protein
MASSPFTLSVTLNVETGSVDVVQSKRTEGDSDNEVIGNRSYPIADIGSSCRLQSDLYGASKKLQDSTSADSKSEHRLVAMDEVWERLKADQWEKPREAGGPTVSAEIEALAELKNAPVAAIQKTLRDLTPEQRERIMANPTVVAKAAEIKQRREEGVSVDLGELMAA